jgi:hypothetical protein
VNPEDRLTVTQIKQHPWYRTNNQFLDDDGKIMKVKITIGQCTNPEELAMRFVRCIQSSPNVNGQL